MADTQIEITPQELKMLPQDSYQLIDTRDDASIAYGMANGAIHIPQEARSRPAHLRTGAAQRPHRDPLLRTRYFKHGARFRAEPPRHPVAQPDGGYNGWLLAHLAGDTPDESEEEKEEARLARQKRIEDSIRRQIPCAALLPLCKGGPRL